jgi:speckle-type POZ protein
MFNIGLIDQTTMSSSTIGRPPSAPVVFNSTVDASVDNDSSSSWGFIMRRTDMELENSSYLSNDSLLFECEITVIKEPQVVKKTATTTTIVNTPQPVCTLTYDLGRLLETMDEADVVFDVQGHVFPAHTFMLAMRSPVFREQFHAAAVRPQLGDGGRHLLMTIEDMQPEVFKALLEFMYTDSMRRRKKGIRRDEKIEFTKNLLVAAYRYDVERLKFECETYLCRSLDVENAATMLDLADRHMRSMLKDACFEFLPCADKFIIWLERNRHVTFWMSHPATGWLVILLIVFFSYHPMW